MQLTDTYFGWQPLTHTNDCDRPAWEIDVRRDEGAHPLPHREDMRHSCTNDDCDHNNLFSRVTVRVICRSCHTAHVISGEELGQSCTTTEALGYGEPPRHVAGLYLWPSEPVLFGYGPGKSGHDDQPRSYLATTHLVDRLQPEHCVGVIGRHHTARHALRWWAGAIRQEARVPGRLDWQRRTTDLTSVAAAAEWIATAQTQTAPVEVTV
ncbi:hypothetical protein [Streptomyces phaeochromogenes]|uniref:hypothetical protein n=1 Tax=Streptomyces phaeochromogenes TaxID=1923 RepID=UPI002DD8416E|nr:hypothetical protein [Streptomyces phaeochromogenes]WRZ30230.1 hypothetical protein OG931_21995 [Streptomyces phaeochromogenes]